MTDGELDEMVDDALSKAFSNSYEYKSSGEFFLDEAAKIHNNRPLYIKIKEFMEHMFGKPLWLKIIPHLFVFVVALITLIILLAF